MKDGSDHGESRADAGRRIGDPRNFKQDTTGITKHLRIQMFISAKQTGTNHAYGENVT
jgi:hypothetical protein